MRVCAFALMSLLSTQTPVLAGFGEPRTSEVVAVTWPWSVDAATLDACDLKKEGSPRAPTYACTVANPIAIGRPIVKTDQSTFEATAPLPESNRFHEEADAILTIVGTPEHLRITVAIVAKPAFRGYDLPLGFKSRDEAIAVAKEVVARRPGGRIDGSLLLLVVK